MEELRNPSYNSLCTSFYHPLKFNDITFNILLRHFDTFQKFDWSIEILIKCLFLKQGKYDMDKLSILLPLLLFLFSQQLRYFQSYLVSKCKYFNLIQENSIKPELQYHKMKIIFQYLLLRSCQLRIVLLKSRILIYLDFMIPVPINYVLYTLKA